MFLLKDEIASSILDATVNRNSDKENGTIYPVTPTKELGSETSIKPTVSSILATIFVSFLVWNYTAVIDPPLMHFYFTR